VKAAGIALTIIMALALQTSLARFLTPGGGLVDLVFVAVVYIALSSGPTAGMIAGAVAGLSQDALAASGTLSVMIGAGSVSTQSIIGIGSLAKTVVGFFAGIIGSQFIVARPLPRALVFFTATVTHAIIFVGLYRVIDRGYTQATVGAILRLGPTRSSVCSSFR
jgi:cell shape-determining protein MreD